MNDRDVEDALRRRAGRGGARGVASVLAAAREEAGMPANGVPARRRPALVGALVVAALVLLVVVGGVLLRPPETATITAGGSPVPLPTVSSTPPLGPTPRVLPPCPSGPVPRPGPVGLDEDAAREALDDALVGCSRGEATDRASASGWRVRPIRLDELDQYRTRELDLGRLNLYVESDRVIGVRVG
jgi:hypothetical protein